MKTVTGNDWDERLRDEWDKPYFAGLRSFLDEEYGSGEVYPPREDIFNALRLTPFEDVKAVILGQDPYHEPGQAQGLAFSVPYGVAQPPSLVNIIKELGDDPWEAGPGRQHAAPRGGAAAAAADGAPPDLTGVLVPWARRGVLLLNTVLTVRAHQAGSHRGAGWEQFTDRIIELLAERGEPLVFILWGAQAGAKRDLILEAEAKGAPGGGRRHLIIQAPHPSPLSAYRGFFGGRYFSRTNYFLADSGIEPIDWTL